jgi:DNA invertase Pin-like site-specific DNA recombinase
VDTSTPAGEMMANVLATFSQFERAAIRGRMAGGKAAKVAKGGYGGGRPAFGVKAATVVKAGKAEKSLVVDDREKKAVQRIKALRAKGASLRDICETLESEGIKTKAGDRWHPTTVNRVLARSK